MKKGKRKSIDDITKKIQHKLGVKFEKKQYPLGKWGKVDRCHLVNSNILIFLEIEIGQSHPDTNVLKVWPYLRQNRRVHVFLIQVISSKCLNDYRSRVLLSEWTGNELKKQFHRRFHYYRIDANGGRLSNTENLHAEFNGFCKDN
jgi:hypothetical protein